MSKRNRIVKVVVDYSVPKEGVRIRVWHERRRAYKYHQYERVTLPTIKRIGDIARRLEYRGWRKFIGYRWWCIERVPFSNAVACRLRLLKRDISWFIIGKMRDWSKNEQE